MRTVHPGVVALAVLAACQVEPPKGTQIGAIREPDPSPAPPSDLTDLDMGAAVADALALAGIVTSASAFQGHLATMERSTSRTCPPIWVGLPPEDLVEIEIGEDEQDGVSWLASCTTDETTFDGFTHWTTAIDDGAGTASRSLVADAVVTDGAGGVLWAFDGESADTLDTTTGAYASSFSGVITGSLSGLGLGLRAQNNTEMGDGGFVAEWSPDGSMRFAGSVEAFDGYGPVDQRRGDEPELEGITGWTPGQPRFTSVRFDLTFDGTCADEPYGFVGLRGNEGFWFDVYFLPIYDPTADSAESNAFPFESIDNQTCDGIGTLFSRNIDLKGIEASKPGWSRELSPDFDAIRTSLPTPTLDSYVYTLRNLPSE